ncbi:MAG: hypothetical protein ABFR97_03555 [Thermodesulfobacteriota bacterium]
MRQKVKAKQKWYDRYLPFIAQPPELQLNWLVTACRKERLTSAELTPYLRLLLSSDNVEEDDDLRGVLANIREDSVSSFLDIVEIYDLPRLISCLPAIDAAIALRAMATVMPSYEKNHQKLVDQVFAAINKRSPLVFGEIAGREDKGGLAPHFRNNIDRFQKILADEEFLRALYPHAS